jgi:hypothetical protein
MAQRLAERRRIRPGCITLGSNKPIRSTRGRMTANASAVANQGVTVLLGKVPPGCAVRAFASAQVSTCCPLHLICSAYLAVFTLLCMASTQSY